MNNELQGKVAELGPWITRFRLGDVAYGGGYDALEDPRIARIPAFVPPPRRILECGCLEGGHTALLARLFPWAEIVALDVREENLRRARLLTHALGVRPPRFLQCDLETSTLEDLGRFDLAVCVGLLYHLQQPWRLLARLAALTEQLWLWTVVCDETAVAANFGPAGEYRGRVYVEGPTDHPLSAVRTDSCFPTIGSLSDMLRTAGFVDQRLLDFDRCPNGPTVLVAANRTPFRVS